MVFSLLKYVPAVKLATEGNPSAFLRHALLLVTTDYTQNFKLLWRQRYSAFFNNWKDRCIYWFIHVCISCVLDLYVSFVRTQSSAIGSFSSFQFYRRENDTCGRMSKVTWLACQSPGVRSVLHQTSVSLVQDQGGHSAWRKLKINSTGTLGPSVEKESKPRLQ